MKLDRLLDDVNLAAISFAESGSELTLAFLTMTDGTAAGLLVCTGLLVFKYQCPPDGGLPVYVGEVNQALVPGEEARPLLQRLGYDFRGAAADMPGSGAAPLRYVCLEGGLSSRSSVRTFYSGPASSL